MNWWTEMDITMETMWAHTVTELLMFPDLMDLPLIVLKKLFVMTLGRSKQKFHCTNCSLHLNVCIPSNANTIANK